MKNGTHKVIKEENIKTELFTEVWAKLWDISKKWQITQWFKRRGSCYYLMPKETIGEAISGIQGKCIVIGYGGKSSHCQNLSWQK